MKRLQVLVFPCAAALAALSSVVASAQAVSDRPPTVALTKAELFAPRFHATGQFSVIQLRNVDTKRESIETLLKTFGAGALAEKQAVEFAATFAASAPVVVKRVLKHYRCPNRANDGGTASVLDCKPVKINYVVPADPTDAAALAECGISVDADVLYLGRKAKTVTWTIDPSSPLVVTNAGATTPRIRLLDVGLDSNGQEVRGITFSDNTDDPQERGEDPAGTDPVFDPAVTSADGQSVVWTRVKAHARLAKVFYYAVVLQLWSDTLQRYVSCAPYDPTVANRGD